LNCAVHLERPAVQPCDRCGNFSCSECLQPFGDQQQCSACRARSSELEWDNRKELGLFRAWWLTSKRMITAPIQTLDVIPPDGTILESSIFAGVSTLAGFLPTLLLYGMGLGAMLAVGAFSDSEVFGAGKAGAAVGIGAFAFIFYLVLLIGMSILFLLISAALELVVLRLAGKPQASYSVSVRAHALAMGTYALGVIPLCGLYVFPIWALVLRVFAIQKLHRVTGGQAAASALIPIGLCCGAGGIFYALIVAMAVAGSKL
jgi:hypothetical protein